MSAIIRRTPAACVKFLISVALCLAAAIPAAAQSTGTDIIGRVQDVNTGLAIPNASVQLLQGNKVVARTSTAPDGSFSFKSEPQGIYNVAIGANGYQSARSSDIVATSAQASVQYQFSLQRAAVGSSSLRTIASVNVGGRAALQTSTTINRSIDPGVLQAQNYVRVGDALASVPGLNASTSSAVGDDLSISIRGFNPSETATLMDGHQIGPIGAQGGATGTGSGGFDYQDSPFWGLRNVQTVFGSGATGIYGATTIAGAVDFQTLEPTRDPHGLVQFGVGNNGKSMTAAQATGTYGKLGYALAYGVQGTYGMFIPQSIPQSGLLGNDITSGNVATNTYEVSGNYTLRNSLLKFAWSFDPTSTLTLTQYSGTSWDDKSGNGDTDFNTYQYVLYNTQQALASGPIAPITLPDGSQLSCGTTGVPVLADTPSGGECLTPQQYAGRASGPAGGGPSPWQAIRNQDYHLRYVQSFGAHTVTVDGFYDNYVVDYNRNFSGGFSSVCNCYTGFFQTNFYKTNGVLASDDFLTGKHDIGFGVYFQHQAHLHDVFGATTFDAAGNPTAYGITWEPQFNLNSDLYFARDQYQPNTRLSFFGDFWVNHTNVTNTTSFDPRLTVMWKPDPSDVVRFTGGQANSVPDPALAFSPLVFNTNYNALNPNCGGLTRVAEGGNPNLQPEKAGDLELSYGHRFGNGSIVQIDGYDAFEQNALFSGEAPLTQLGILPAQSVLNGIYARISSICPNIPNPSPANLSASTTFNAATARYQGIEFSGNANIVRYLSLFGDFTIQSAVFNGVPDQILMSNPYIINGGQIEGVPFHKGDVGFTYGNPAGFAAGIDGHFVDSNNGWHRPAFWWANANVSNTWGHVTLNLGFNNLFNSNAGGYGLIGLGLYQPVNSFNASSLPNSLAEGRELFFLPYRQAWLTITQRF